MYKSISFGVTTPPTQFKVKEKETANYVGLNMVLGADDILRFISMQQNTILINNLDKDTVDKYLKDAKRYLLNNLKQLSQSDIRSIIEYGADEYGYDNISKIIEHNYACIPATVEYNYIFLSELIMKVMYYYVRKNLSNRRFEKGALIFLRKHSVLNKARQLNYNEQQTEDLLSRAVSLEKLKNILQQPVLRGYGDNMFNLSDTFINKMKSTIKLLIERAFNINSNGFYDETIIYNRVHDIRRLSLYKINKLMRQSNVPDNRKSLLEEYKKSITKQLVFEGNKFVADTIIGVVNRHINNVPTIYHSRDIRPYYKRNWYRMLRENTQLTNNAKYVVSECHKSNVKEEVDMNQIPNVELVDYNKYKELLVSNNPTKSDTQKI